MSDTEIKALIGKLRWCNTVATSEAADMLQQHLTSKQEAAEREEQLVEAMRSGIARAEAQHEATKQELSDYKQKVSDVVKAYVYAINPHTSEDDWENLKALIIPAPKPDPLVEVLRENFNIAADQMEADKFRATLCAFGLQIVEKNDD